MKQPTNSPSPLNVYPGIYTRPTHTVTRVTVAVPREDTELIIRVCPIRGIVQATVATVIKNICEYLRSNSTTELDVTEYVAILRRLADCGSANTGHVEDVASGADSIRSRPAAAKHSNRSTRRAGTRASRSGKSGSKSGDQPIS